MQTTELVERREVATLGLEDELDQIVACDDKEWLLKKIEGVFWDTVRGVMVMAACLKQIKHLDPDAEVNLPILPYLRKVADGSMLPELLVRMQGSGRLLSKAASLPTDDQRRIADDVPIRVMQADGEHRMIKPSELTSQQITQLFAGIRLRSEVEQVTWLKERDDRRRFKALQTEPTDWEVDKRRGGVVYNGMFIPNSLMAQMLAASTR